MERGKHQDREKIADELLKHSHPLKVTSSDLYNIVNGQIAPKEGTVNYNLTEHSPLPKRDAVMKNKFNKLQLSKVLSSFNLGDDVKCESRDKGVFYHDEADVTMIAYLFRSAEDHRVLRILSDSSDVLVIIIYFVWKTGLHHTCLVQLEHWNGNVRDINATCKKLGPKCLKLMGMHALTGCDTVSFPFNKGKIGALKVLQAGNFPGLFKTLGEIDATNDDLM